MTEKRRSPTGLRLRAPKVPEGCCAGDRTHLRSRPACWPELGDEANLAAMLAHCPEIESSLTEAAGKVVIQSSRVHAVRANFTDQLGGKCHTVSNC